MKNDALFGFLDNETHPCNLQGQLHVFKGN